MKTITRLSILLLLCWTAVSSAAAAGAEPEPQLKLATFDLEATPPVGSIMAYNPVKRVDALGLRCRGVVLLGAGEPIVLCAVDWIGISNESQDAFRDALASAVGTRRERVALHTLHQHDAPGSDFTVERLLKDAGKKDLGRYDGDFQRQVIRRAAEAARSSLAQARPVTHCGWGEADVAGLASNRRILGADGRVRATRYTATRDPALRAEPEGVIDPKVSVLSFWSGDQPLAVLSYYACHPQSYYLTGVPSPDIPGIARLVREQALPDALHVHFNGAGGNIGAGKYNDGSPENRVPLALRLAEGMKRALESTKKFPVRPADLGWSVAAVTLPPAPHLVESKLRDELKQEDSKLYLAAANRLAYLLRCRNGNKIDIACLSLGDVRVIHLPGELFVEYQLAAKRMRPDLHIAVAAYGDCAPGYIGTAAAYGEGGYETGESASKVGPDAERILMDALGTLLNVKP